MREKNMSESMSKMLAKRARTFRHNLPDAGQIEGESLSIAIASLLMVPQLTIDEIAVRTGCKREDVVRIKAMQGMVLAPAMKAHYMLMLENKIPADVRAGSLKGIILGDHPYAAIRAVEYVDSVLGVGPPKEQPVDYESHTSLFELPAGTRVQVALTAPQTFDLPPDAVRAVVPGSDAEFHQVEQQPTE